MQQCWFDLVRPYIAGISELSTSRTTWLLLILNYYHYFVQWSNDNCADEVLGQWSMRSYRTDSPQGSKIFGKRGWVWRELKEHVHSTSEVSSLSKFAAIYLVVPFHTSGNKYETNFRLIYWHELVFRSFVLNAFAKWSSTVQYSTVPVYYSPNSTQVE